MLVAVALLATGGAPSTVAACASCGCGDPTLTAMGVEKPFKNRIRLALEERVSAHTDEEGRTILARTTLAAAWSPSAWVTLGAALPVPSGELRPTSGPLRRFGGLGDLEVYARPLVFRERRFSPRHLLSLLAGCIASWRWDWARTSITRGPMRRAVTGRCPRRAGPSSR